MPGGEAIGERYGLFRGDLPGMCEELRLVERQLTFVDYTWLISRWQKAKEIVASPP
jgi:hypothetical protein